MAVKTKAVLKTYFETGDKPTQSQFEDLIDTMVDSAQLEGSLFYGGTVDDAGVCTLSNGFKDRFGIDELTMTVDNAGGYNGAYFVCSVDGTSGVPGTLEALASDWIVASENAWGKMSDVATSAITDSEIDSLD